MPADQVLLFHPKPNLAQEEEGRAREELEQEEIKMRGGGGVGFWECLYFYCCPWCAVTRIMD